MPDIQLDMFEVQLGAAILLQFRLDGRTVRVLADGGVARSYPHDHVRDKLLGLLPPDQRRIDLVIGTHYDEDHLNGLVPLINDTRFDFGEAWLPPVANEAQTFALDQPLAKGDLLAHQFAGEGGRGVIETYLGKKRADIQGLWALAPEEALGVRSEKASFFASAIALDDMAFFRFHAEAADGDCHHCGELDADIPPDAEAELRTRLWRARNFGIFDEGMSFSAVAQMAKARQSPDSGIAAAQFRTVDNIRKGAARDAINAKALFEVVKALEGRQVPFRTEIIPDGTPRYYRWTPASDRFLLARDAGAGLSFSLLGPSQSLVRKHRDRLPVIDYAKAAFLFRGEIRSITPSNQLSYIGCFQHEGQRILISGDAGCVDFKEGRQDYYPQLLAELKPLHVIQVAHHGGANAHFYRVLSAAQYEKQTAPSYLLLSHGVDDDKRPSDVFRDFLMTARSDGDDIRLLFASRPTRDKVVDYLSAIHPAVGTVADRGDVQMVCDAGAWRVTHHAVQV